ncbi:hypothetical protein JCM24511_00647 [Saitozyma sp. JCM 24511]|nr:hypothetical protein JCM24511_00647 [Saitozyma sp. JCM 24511]
MTQTQTDSPITYDRAEELIRLLTDGLVNIKDKTGQFLLKLKDGSIIDTKGWQGWEWTHGIALTALYHHSRLDPSSPSAQFSKATALAWFESQYKITEGKGAPKNINTMAPFYCLAGMLYDGSVKDERWTRWCDEWAEWIMNDLPRTEENGFQHITYANPHTNNLWDDTLMMTVIPLAQIGVLLKRPHYIEEAKYQFLLHIKYLTNPSTGLWYHGWEYTPEKGSLDFGHNFAGALWARGNAWITVSIPIFLEILGDRLAKDDPVRLSLIATLKRQVDALVACQDKETGMWHTLLVDPTSYVETSATAGFAAGILMALRMGLLSSPTYLSTANLALTGILSNIRPDGEVENVSFGTGVGYTQDFYKKIAITSMPYGQALAMLAFVEWERMQRA